MNGVSPVAVNAGQVKVFDRDGVLHLPSLFDEHWVELLRAGIERNLKQPGPNGHDIRNEGEGQRFFEDAFVWPDNPEYRTFLFDSHVAEVAGRLMRRALSSTDREMPAKSRRAISPVRFVLLHDGFGDFDPQLMKFGDNPR